MEDIVFIDLNGTLIGDFASSISFTKDQIERFQQRVTALKANGISVGIASDSPLKQLFELVEKLELDSSTPILAENGNLFWSGKSVWAIRQFSARVEQEVKQQLMRLATEFGYGEPKNIVAKEFLGHPLDFTNVWGLGAYRHTSISVFGQPDFLLKANDLVFEILSAYADKDGLEFSLDCAPQHNYFGIHPINDFTRAKEQSIAAITKHRNGLGTQRNTWLIGNANSDYVGTQIPGARSLFVGNSRLSDEIIKAGVYISDDNDFEGVLDCLDMIIEEVNIEPIAIGDGSNKSFGVSDQVQL